MIIAALLFINSQQTLSDWTIERAPYGFDITPDASMWINIAGVGRKDDYAILAEDMRREEGKRWQLFWVRGYHVRNPDVLHRESKTQYRIDCELREITTTMRVTYGADGSVLSEWTAPSNGFYGEQPIVPGSLGARLSDFVCPATSLR